MKINIVDIIKIYVPVKKLGPGYIGTCPFCGAKGKTDFIISVRYQNYSCRICGSSGGIFQFLMKLKGYSLEDTLNEVKSTFEIPFDAHFLDERWNLYLANTDFKQVIKNQADKSRMFLDEQLPKEYKRLTYTQLATFIRCPLEYKTRYIEKTQVFQPGGTRVNLGRFLLRWTPFFGQELLQIKVWSCYPSRGIDALCVFHR